MKNYFVYLLVLEPDPDTDMRAKMVKAEFKSKFGCSFSDNLKPHITLSNFLLLKHMEKKVISCFDIFAKSVKPFSTEIDGYGYFGSKTIFLNVISEKPIIKLMKDLRTRYKKFMEVDKAFPAKFPTSSPHMTIAREMLFDQFEKAWSEYGNKTFKSTFQANDMLLLRKRYLGGKNYEVIRHFPFTATGDENVQLSMDL